MHTVKGVVGGKGTEGGCYLEAGPHHHYAALNVGLTGRVLLINTRPRYTVSP
jgi:hypothetical protein